MTIRRADDNVYVLGTGLTGTGAAVPIKGGTYIFMVSGTAGGGTNFTLEIQNPAGVWSRVQVFTGSIVTFAAAVIPIGQTGVELPAGNARIAISGTATSIDAYLIGLG